MCQNIRSSLGRDGVLVSCIDMPGRASNVFSRCMMDSLEQLLDHVEANQAVRGVVLTSGKPGFFVGPEAELLRVLTGQSHDAATDMLQAACARLGGLLRRLEHSSKPFVAAINGAALGAGLELALACHQRILVDAPAVMLGMPDIRLGLVPCAGGTQRLPRLIGAEMALHMLITGQSMSPIRALKSGLVHELVPAHNLIDAARRCALAAARVPPDVAALEGNCLPHSLCAGSVSTLAARAGVSVSQRTRYPAYDILIGCVIDGLNLSVDAALRIELDAFIKLIRLPVTRNMVTTLVLNRQRVLDKTLLSPGLAGVRMGAGGDPSGRLREVLERASVPMVNNAELVEGDVALACGSTAAVQLPYIVWLRDNPWPADLHQVAGGFWVADSSEHGRVAEMLVLRADSGAAEAGRNLAQWLHATLLISTGKSGFLPPLARARDCAINLGCGEDEVVFAVALAAARAWLSGAVAQPELADVAAVLAGLHPAYTGGPFTYLRHCGSAQLRKQAGMARRGAALLFSVPPQIERVFSMLHTADATEI